ncbi:MAG: glycoside hydrolase family 32 protein [Ginsengibacter sp.]
MISTFNKESFFMKILLASFICFFVTTTFSQPADKIKNSQTYRPTFHFTPKQNWINDPNGLVYYKNNYHLYFQHNPFGNKWGHMSWGHATSKDLMKWKQTTVAIPEYKNADGTVTMIFSGTAVVDSFNTSGFGTKEDHSPLVAVYTANIIKHDTGFAQYQNIAYSFNGVNFMQYKKNPVLDIKAKDFRDPKIFWYQPGRKWIMIVSKPTDFKVQFYSSTDLKSWTYLSEFGNTGNQDRVWECPDIFEMPVENGNEKKWVITLSAGHPQNGYLAMQYFVGEFDGNSFKADNLSYPLYIDYGKDFYAGITYNNLPVKDRRRIMIGWANSWEYANDIPTKGFRGMMAIPRTLSLLKSKDGKYMLLQQPIEELKTYRGKMLFDKKTVSIKNGTNNPGINGDALDIEFVLAKNDLEKSGIKVFKHGEEETLIYFDKKNNTVKIDRTKSGNVNFSKRFPGIDSVRISSGDGDLKFRILIDKSIVEVFINNGEYALTDLVFPTKENGAIEFFTTPGLITEFKNVKIWKMNSLMRE